MRSAVLTGCERRGCRRLELRVPTVVRFDDASLRLVRNADLGMSVTVVSLTLATRHSAEIGFGSFASAPA
jgi:hypothetical protein